MGDTTELAIRYHSKGKCGSSRLVSVDPMWDWRGTSEMDSATASFHRQTSNTRNPYHQSSFLRNQKGNLHRLVLHSLQDLSIDTGARRLQRGRMLPPGLLWENLRAPGRALGPSLRLSARRLLTGHGILRRAARCALGSTFGVTHRREDAPKG